MKPGHWQKVEEIFQKALHRDPTEGDAFLRKERRGDAELHREVSSLLANHREALCVSSARPAQTKFSNSVIFAKLRAEQLPSTIPYGQNIQMH
jgi:hypothetical protein